LATAELVNAHSNIIKSNT